LNLSHIHREEKAFKRDMSDVSEEMTYSDRSLGIAINRERLLVNK